MNTDGRKRSLAEVSETVVDAAKEVHRSLGPGLPKKDYVDAFGLALQKHGIAFQCKVWLPEQQGTLILCCGYSLDFVIENAIIVEVPAGRRVTHEDEDRMMKYLRLSGRQHGLVINFNAHALIDGVRHLYSGDAMLAAC